MRRACCSYSSRAALPLPALITRWGTAKWDTRWWAPAPDVCVRTQGVGSLTFYPPSPPSWWPPSEEAILVYSALENHDKHLSCQDLCLKMTSSIYSLRPASAEHKHTQFHTTKEKETRFYEMKQIILTFEQLTLNYLEYKHLSKVL